MTTEDDRTAKAITNRMLAMWADAGKRGEIPDLGDYENELIGDYLDAMAEQTCAEGEVAKWSDRRAYALAKLHAHGWSYQRISDVVCLSRSRVQQLVERGADVVP
jgi:DNA-directed RNA polymerase specialized sigma24 family protein